MPWVALAISSVAWLWRAHRPNNDGRTQRRQRRHHITHAYVAAPALELGNPLLGSPHGVGEALLVPASAPAHVANEPAQASRCGKNHGLLCHINEYIRITPLYYIEPYRLAQVDRSVAQHDHDGPGLAHIAATGPLPSRCRLASSVVEADGIDEGLVVSRQRASGHGNRLTVRLRREGW